MGGEPPQATFLNYSVSLQIGLDCAGPAQFYWLDLGAADTRQRAGRVTIFAACCFAFQKNRGEEYRNKLEIPRLRLE